MSSHKTKPLELAEEEEPDIIVRLSSGPINPFTLNLGQGRAQGYVQIELERQPAARQEAVTLVLDGNGQDITTLDAAVAVQSGLLELVDAESGEPISIPRKDFLPSSASIMATGRRHGSCLLSWDLQSLFWRSHVQVGHGYLLRFSPTDGLLRCLYSNGSSGDDQVPTATTTAVAAAAATHSQATGPSLPVHRALHPPIPLRVIAPAPPPTFTLSLTASSTTCPLNPSSSPTPTPTSPPPFSFTLTLTSPSPSPITVSLRNTCFQTRTSLSDLISIHDLQTAQPVKFPKILVCSPAQPPFPPASSFYEFTPGEPYVRTYPLRWGKGGKAGRGGELDRLVPGRKYIATPGKRMMSMGFGVWRVGTKEELLREEEEHARRGEGEGKTKKWRERWGAERGGVRFVQRVGEEEGVVFTAGDGEGEEQGEGGALREE
ncbi:hypothetical protein MMC24_006876 [Lignoscripta atroalba]|nr:hypothetical protein [Lignoscripta atroalba]